MEKVIVTGGNGFIGTNLILSLLEDKNNKILNIDKFSYYSNSYLLKNKFINIKNIKNDLLNFDKIISCLVGYLKETFINYISPFSIIFPSTVFS